MKIRRILTAALACVMLLSAVPFGAMAADTAPAEEGKLFLDKTATLTDDGSYTINLEAYATGQNNKQTITSGVPLDIVLVLDQSGSMAEGHVKINNKRMTYQEALKYVVGKFIENVVANGKEAKVTHRMAMVGFASGPLEGDYSWNSTGLFDNTGKWTPYNDRLNGETTEYVPFDGELQTGSTYYVKVNGTPVKLTYNAGAESLEKVTAPEHSRQDIVNSEGRKTVWGEYTETTRNEVNPKPTTDDGTQYYAEDGTKLTWKTITVPGEKKPGKKAESIVAGKHYYILYNDQYLEIWQHGDNNWWRDKENYAYDVDGANFTYGIWPFKTSYPAYEQITTESTTKTALTTADGKEYTGTVYTQTTATKTDWHVEGTATAVPENELYVKKAAQGAWQYMKGDKLVNRTDEQVFVAQTVGKMHSALMPVTDGANGQGTTTQALIDAKDAIKADGGTRPTFGIQMANEIFAANPIEPYNEQTKQGRKRIMIVFTDGEPGYNGYDDVEAYKSVTDSYETKHKYGATVYSIGLYGASPSNDVKNFLSYLSSDYPDAKYDYQELSSKPRNKNFIIRYKGDDALAKDSQYRKVGGKQNGEAASWRDIPQGATYYKYDTNLFQPGTKANPAAYSKTATDGDALKNIFEDISREIGGTTTQVDLTTTSILRDIMSAEGFELTNDSVVTVNVVPGSVTEKIPADQLTKDKINWEAAKTVVTLRNPAHGKSETGTYTDSHSPAHSMTIKASTYMENPETGKKNLHTVDVTGFDYKDQFITDGHKGSMLQVIITGVKALPSVTTDKNIYTNFYDPAQENKQSGIWAPVENGEYNMKAPFPVKPQTHMPSKSYVVDYAKPLDLKLADFKLDSAQNLDVDGYDPFAPANTEIKHTYGNVNVNGKNLTYTPKTMNWDGYDTFYVFGTTNDKTVTAASANANGNVWAKVNVIPANNVYYEDTFISNETTGTVGITYTGEWTEVKETPDANVGNNPGAESSGDNHGWIPVLDGENGDTDGSSHHAKFEEGKEVATATFTFTGTGVDIYSRTNGQTGTIMATLKSADGNITVTQIVDTLSASGEYYQVPTLSFYKDSKKAALPHGTYTVTIKVVGAAKTRFEYYLDGIRVYNPMNKNDDTVKDAYGPDEMNATFMEVRDMLLDAKSFSAEENGVSHGCVFIDQLNNGTDGAPGTEGNTDKVLGVGTYEDLGPKNEVYLKPYQSISFKVDTTKGNKFQIGLKSPTDTPATASFSGADGNAQTISITHTADMYYAVAPASNGVITITNMSKGNELLSITKLKVTNETAPVNTAAVFAETDVPTLLAATQAFMDAPVEPEVPTEPTEPETQPTEPTEPSTPDVDIENPTEPQQPEKPSRPSIGDILDKIFGGILGWH